jgi:hypothetical protein
LRTPNKKLFIGLIKYSVGCSLIAIYMGFLMVGAGNISTKGISDIISNITVLITSIFFFIDGINDIYDYLDEKDGECKDRTDYETYIKFGMKKKYVFKKIMFFKRMQTWLYFFIIYIININIDKINISNIILNVLNIVVLVIIAIVVLPFGDVYINLI